MVEPEERVTQAQVDLLVRRAEVPQDIARKVLQNAERKLAGQRSKFFVDTVGFRRATSIVFNEPEFLRRRQAVLGRGRRPGAAPLRKKIVQIKLPPKKIIVSRKKAVAEEVKRKPVVKITRELPPRKIISKKITFGQPRRFAESFRRATGDDSFTIAIPLRRQNGKLFVQDFNFLFENGKLVRSRRTGSALLTEKQFLAADKRRRKRNPGFTFGDTRLVAPVKKKIKFKERPFVKKIISISDVISGRAITRSRISKEQDKLNRDVGDFNKKFENKPLSESQFVEAQKQSSRLENQQKSLDKRQETFEKSRAKKIGDIVFRTEKLFPSSIKEKDIPKEVKKKQRELENIQRKKRKAKGLNKKRLITLERAKKKEISNTKKGIGTGVIAGIVPLTPAGIPIKGGSIRFIGKQKRVGKGIVTDIVFEVNKKRVGFARGISIVRGKKTSTITIGRSGIKGVKFPSGKTKIGRIRSFVGVEKGLARPRLAAIRTQVRLIKGGRVNVITKNIKSLRQISRGRVGVIRGQKLIRSGVKARGINIKDFASISSTFTRKDLSLIIGRSITTKGAKVKFIGLIKGTSKVGKGFTLTGKQQLQFKNALNKVISATASASASSGKVSGLTALQRNALASSLIKRGLTAKPRAVQKVPLTRQKVKVVEKKIIQKAILTTKVRQRLSKKQIQIVQTKTKQVQKLVTKQKALTKQLTKQAQKLTTRQITRLRLAQRLVQQQITSLATQVSFIPGISPLIPLAVLKRKKKRKKKKKKVVKLKQGYDVFSRPTRVGKGKRRRIVKLNKVPLTKTKARDLGSFVADKSLARTFSIRKTKGTVRKPRLRVPSGHFSRTKKKFRAFKIVKGKRVSLKNKRIEKRRNILDTRSEKRGLTLKRQLALLQKKSKKKPKRKMTKKQLSNLAKGRKMLAKKRGKRR